MTDFEEHPFSDEPASDRRLVLPCGMQLRERVSMADAHAQGVRSGASDPAATALTIVISHALLDDEARVATLDGRPVIAPAYEVAFTTEALGRLGSEEAVQEAINDARRVAAAQAAQAVRGAALMAKLLPGRITQPTEETNA